MLGIGEIGLNKNTRNELAILERHIDLGHATGPELILVHTPHLEDKLKGECSSSSTCSRADSRVRPERVIIDHVEEHTVDIVLDAGFWAGITLYPEIQMHPRARRGHGGKCRDAPISG